ncbi:MAG TPA: long-chain-fatty-acid--CoA ligase [Acidimicrobiales bacterium]|nr:long-chain-fatty-acid--CoA ligase [Acidimicrobiales bacterium]
MTDVDRGAVAALDAARSMAHGEQLARQARLRPAKVAYRFSGRELTFGELDERVNRLASALVQRGVGQGDRVATLMGNRLEVVETYLAAAKLGAICVPVNFRLVADEIAYVLGDSRASAMVVDAALAPTAATARAVAGSPAVCLVVADDAAAGGDGAEPYEAVLAAASPEPPGTLVREGDDAFIMYTSGTTGRPKGAVLSHFNLLMNTLHMTQYMGIQGDDEVWLSGLPLFHIGGLNGILPYLLIGGTCVVLPSGQFDAVEVVDTLERERITGCYFVPTQWQQICAVPGVRDRDLALRRISWGASVAPPSVLQAMADAFPGVPNYNAFGQTEMSSVTCVLLGEDAVRKMGAVGTPVNDVEVRIVDDDMADVGTGEVGEIIYRGPTVMQRYWEKPEATADAFAGGWFHSGDLVRRDEEGYISVVDRKKDMIISGGENIYCAEVEAVIDAHPAVREVALIGVPHDRWVETPRAVVVPLDPADPPTETEIIDWCRARLASYKKPTSVVVVDELPRNASGKVLKTRLRDLVGTDER